jgi:hypothetical protein
MFRRTFKSAQRFYFFSAATPRGIDDEPHLVDVQRPLGSNSEVIFTVVVLYGDSLPSDRDF